MVTADGIKKFYEAKTNKPHSITRERMMNNFFSRRLDGQRHAWIPAMTTHHCQYCHYVWANEYDADKQETFKWKKQHKFRVIRCLVCNVNLCHACDHEFHGTALSLTNG